jgi:hypothetical protein
MIEESSSPVLDADRIEVPSPKEENNSTNSEAATGTEDFEISDVDDDDRNHKHRRREARPQSDDNTEEQHPGNSIKKKEQGFWHWATRRILCQGVPEQELTAECLERTSTSEPIHHLLLLFALHEEEDRMVHVHPGLSMIHTLDTMDFASQMAPHINPCFKVKSYVLFLVAMSLTRLICLLLECFTPSFPAHLHLASNGTAG